MLAPLLLAPDNFTPTARTPWGGRRIMNRYKAALGLDAALATQAVGEAWELSLGPELPSRVDDGRWLHEIVAAAPEAYLGKETARGGSALLVKWLDAADDLSVQIHPDACDPGLAAHETGKPECWYIVERDVGAGIYLGLRAGVSDTSMRDALARGADVSQLLEFVPVAPGDFFLLAPGLPHAVGRGITLLEPQYVAPGKKGVTLRYWDWNRRYDAQGRASPQGVGRELHVERALAVTRWSTASDPAFLASQRCSLGEPQLSAAARVELLCGTDALCPVQSPHLRVARVCGHGRVQLPALGTLSALTVVAGSLRLCGAFGALQVDTGRTAALPAGLGGLEVDAQQAHALLSSVIA